MSSSTTPTTTAAPSENALDFLRLDAELGEDEQLVCDAVARMVDKRVLPIISECFEAGRFPRELLPELAALGVFGSTLQGYGCAGLNAVSYGLICRELERGDSALRSFVSVQSSLCMYPIYTYGSEQQKQQWLPRMARGEVIGCFGLTEPQGGSDPATMGTTARRNGDGWILSGSKMWITNGHIADLAIVWAQTPDGMRGFLVERGARGFTSEEIKHKSACAPPTPARCSSIRCGCRPRPRCRQPPASRHRCPACRRPAMASAGACRCRAGMPGRGPGPCRRAGAVRAPVEPHPGGATAAGRDGASARHRAAAGAAAGAAKAARRAQRG